MTISNPALAQLQLAFWGGIALLFVPINWLVAPSFDACIEAGAFVGANYPNESFTLSLGVGGGLILLANVLMQWKRSPDQSPE